MPTVTLDGRSLTIEQVRSVAVAGERTGISAEARERMTASRAVVERLAAGPDAVYGVNTGFGLLADILIPPDQIEQLQRNLVCSHACGVGEPLRPEEVRAMMLIRANVLAKGYSGIRPEIAELLCEMLNRGVTPVVPSRGSVGASGDLAPLAHMALVLIGEGEAEFDGDCMKGADALRLAGLEPVTLKSKEGISLLNGTQAMLAVGCLSLLEAEALMEAADVACAMSLDALRGTPCAFDPRVHEIRPHPGQTRTAENLRRLLEGSEIRASHLSCRRVQDAYSLRCAPQVHGAVRDALVEARRVLEIELNSATDNPLVIDGEIFSGGNFHGEPLALVLDAAANAVTALSGICERRVDRLVNPALNEHLPAFLTKDAGIESGFMMAQVTAAAMVAENRVLATPAAPGSITTSGNKEDFVSMGMTSALKFQQTVKNACYVTAIELLCAARALDCLRPLKSSAPIEAVRAKLSEVSPAWEHDRALSADIEEVSELISGGEVGKAVMRVAL